MNLTAFVAAHEPAIRISAFLSVFAVIALWEVLAPRRALALPRARRWTANLGIAVLNTVLVRLLVPAAAVGAAALAADRGWGLAHYLAAPYPLAVLASVVALDLAIYLQHLAFHAVPALWRLHRVHHADLDFDLTTGARFHPVEIALSLLIKFAAIIALGAPVLAVVVFEVLLSAAAIFNHGNIRLPAPADRGLRWLLVTPDMHRVHHSADPRETSSNFGFNLSGWDRLFGTYRDAPAAGHEAMAIGVAEFRDPAQCATLTGLLALPFTEAHAGDAAGPDARSTPVLVEHRSPPEHA